MATGSKVARNSPSRPSGACRRHSPQFHRSYLPSSQGGFGTVAFHHKNVVFHDSHALHRTAQRVRGACLVRDFLCFRSGLLKSGPDLDWVIPTIESSLCNWTILGTNTSNQENLEMVECCSDRLPIASLCCTGPWRHKGELSREPVVAPTRGI
jgi:hypothetical protein